MLLPIRTNIRPWRVPYANYLLIAANVVIFLLTYWPHRVDLSGRVEILRDWALPLMLNPADSHLWQFFTYAFLHGGESHLWQFVTYAFLHGGLMHIFGNMFFLYLFGNNVNDRLGHIGYTCFYLAGAVFSAIGHILLNEAAAAPMLGASGAVAAVTGAYLVLFPQTLITVVYWFIFIGTMELPALYFIAIKMIILDNLIARYTPNVAYDAHIAGYGFGVAATMLLLSTGLVSSSGMDLWSMLKQWNRRRKYRDVVTNGYDPFASRPSHQIKVKEINRTDAEKKTEEKIQQFRTEISARLTQRNLPAAAGLYLELVELDNQQVLPRQQLLDIANQLAGENKFAEAAQAYEQFLTHYANCEYAEQVELMVGILYSRYLNKPALAINHLNVAAQKLSDAGQLKMCRDELAKLAG